MALIYCRECGQKISEQAPSCPKCGVPTRSQNKNGLFVSIIFILIVGAGLYLYLTAETAPPIPSETRQDRIDEADRLLSKDCETLTNMSTEYIKNDVAAAFINALGSTKCDCLKEKLREKLADKFTLIELQDFEKKPIHKVEEIQTLIKENNVELKECFPLLN